MNDYFNQLLGDFGKFFSDYGLKIVAAIVLLIIGYFLITYLCKLLLRIIYATKMDNAVGAFIAGIIKFFMWLGMFFIIAALFGISGNSLLVTFSSLALAVGLALKDSLSNVANGIIIIATKPFRKGDHIIVKGIEGKVKKINVMNTELFTFNNQKVVIPNSTIVTSEVINFTANPLRRLDLEFGASYNSDPAAVKQALYDAITACSLVHETPAPTIIFKAHDSSAIVFLIKVWVNTAEYWDAYSQMNEDVFNIFKARGIEIPYNQLDVNFRTPISVKGDVKDEK